MIVTEAEAKTKLCQEAFGPGSVEWHTVPEHRTCIGSACMAWRWLDPTKFVDQSRTAESLGYCGKAGRP